MMKIGVVALLLLASFECSANACGNSSRMINNLNNVKENECYRDHQILFNGECYSLLTKAACSEGEWLVLDIQLTLKSTHKLNSICTKKLCPNQQIYWQKTNSCIPHDKKKMICSMDGTVMKVNSFGFGICECINKPPHVTLHPRVVESPCYPLYHQGPCKVGQILVERSYGIGECVINPCVSNSTNPTMAQNQDGDKRCYALNSKGPCKNGQIFDVHWFTRKPICHEPELNLLNLVGSIPTICKTDYNNECTDSVDVQKPNQLYKNKLFHDIKVQREKDKLTKLS